MADHDCDAVMGTDAGSAEAVVCLLCGPAVVEFSHALESAYDVRSVADTAVDAAVAELNRLVPQRDSGICVVCHSQGSTPADSVVDLVNTLANNPEADIAWPVPDHGSLWSPLPAVAACRAWRPDRDGPLAFRQSCWVEHGPFAAHSHALWEWVLRATAAGCSLAAQTVSRNVHASSLPDLAPTRPHSDWDWLQRQLSAEDVTGCEDAADASVACRAGLLQMHDFLEESHRFAQSIEGRGRLHDGDYWHAIMHRREPDFSNSKYWFRRVGAHPVFDGLGPVADALLAQAAFPSASEWRSTLCGSGWDPLAFVDLCQEALSTGDRDLISVAKQIQQAEMECLLGHCWNSSSDACP